MRANANKLNFYAHIQIRLNMYTISMKLNPIMLDLSFFHVNPLQNHKIISIIMHINTVEIIFIVFISLTPLACNKQSNRKL